MEYNIYKYIVENSKIPYINIKINNIDDINRSSIEVKNHNQAFERLFLSNKDINSIIKNYDKEDENIREIYLNAKKNKKYTFKKYIENIKIYFDIEVFYDKNNEFHFYLCKIEDKNEELTNIVRKYTKTDLEKEEKNMDLLTNISHELRTPINLILSVTQLLNLKKNKLDIDTCEYFEKYINIINQNGTRLLKLVNNILNISNEENRNIQYNIKNQDIISCVENICISSVPYINKHNLEIIFDTDTEEKIIAFDKESLESIVLNLISNAVKFNKPNGKIEVSINCDDDIKISVKDTGIGIDKKNIDIIFNKFEKLKTDLNNNYEGNGIGLFLVKHLLERHNGTIFVNSEMGKGSEFIITLPNKLINSRSNNI